MKIVCTDNGTIFFTMKKELTIGKVYDAMLYNYRGEEYYRLLNDNNYESNYLCKRFKPLNEIREEKINTIIDGI